jgi:hypothetical protein
VEKATELLNINKLSIFDYKNVLDLLIFSGREDKNIEKLKQYLSSYLKNDGTYVINPKVKESDFLSTFIGLDIVINIFNENQNNENILSKKVHSYYKNNLCKNNQ